MSFRYGPAGKTARARAHPRPSLMLLDVETPFDIQAALERGTAQFSGHEVLVERGVLVPRVVTEVLIQAAVKLFPDTAVPLVAVDLCTGTGNVAVALAVAFPRARVYATDLVPQAVRLAERNAAKLGVSARTTAHEGDLFGALDPSLRGEVNLVVSSPPFISSAKLAHDRAALLELEPREAFDAGPYGLLLHQRIAREAPDYVARAGWLVLEFGRGQAAQVERLIARTRAFDSFVFFEGPEGFINAVAARRS